MTILLTMRRCVSCGRIDPGLTGRCTGCSGDLFYPVDVPGRGRVDSWTIIRRAPARFRAQAPYVVAVVDLQDGVRVTGRLTQEPSGHGVQVEAIAADNAILFEPLRPSQPSG